MKVTVKVFGVQELVAKMGGNREIEIDFPGGNVSNLFSSLLERFGFRLENFPLLVNWEQNPSITILHNGEILNKEDYARKILKDGDRVSFLLYTGCC